MPGVSSFEELDAWKLSAQLRDLIYGLVETGGVLKDQTFCEQIRGSASSAPANIAEGWGRFKPKDHANFCRIAKASLEETRNHLFHGRNARYFSEQDFTEAMRLTRRAIGATVGLIKYLDSCKGRLPWDSPPKSRRPNQNQNREPGT